MTVYSGQLDNNSIDNEHRSTSLLLAHCFTPSLMKLNCRTSSHDRVTTYSCNRNIAQYYSPDNIEQRCRNEEKLHDKSFVDVRQR